MPTVEHVVCIYVCIYIFISTVRTSTSQFPLATGAGMHTLFWYILHNNILSIACSVCRFVWIYDGVCNSLWSLEEPLPNYSHYSHYRYM